MEVSMNNNQTIKCDVKSCKFYKNNDLCNLKDIKVTCTCNKNIANKTETVCNSFQKK